MRDVRQALETLKDLTGLQQLAFDAGGRAEIVVQDSLSVYLVRISETVMEIAAHVATDRRQPTDGGLRDLLRANADAGLADARFALDSAGVPFLCQRVDVAALEPDDLDRILLDFIRRVTRLRQGGPGKAS
ncbi:type III secretion system chaperone [Aquibium microcysteis]|uniref:type III secretion system chaperone n=1 Tax=Aquibium microcysteis TaxID=675281 RepID=UPI00165D2092|nr:type III secretion system chaperone [Aquibium microcysteis]